MPASTIMEIKVGEKVRRKWDLSTPNAKLFRVMLPEAMSDHQTLMDGVGKDCAKTKNGKMPFPIFDLSGEH